MLVPAAVIQLNEPDRALGHPLGKQAVGGKRTAAMDVWAVALHRLVCLIAQVWHPSMTAKAFVRQDRLDVSEKFNGA